MILKRRLSVDDYLALPETKPYVEYVHGKAVSKPVPDKNHMRIAGTISYHLVGYAREHGGFAGPEGRSEFVDRSDPRFLLPAVSYFAAGRPSGTGSRMAAPALAVEVRSRDQSLSDLREKCEYYISHGVETVWLIEPQRRRAEVFVAGQPVLSVVANGSLRSGALPDLEIALAELFADVE